MLKTYLFKKKKTTYLFPLQICQFLPAILFALLSVLQGCYLDVYNIQIVTLSWRITLLIHNKVILFCSIVHFWPTLPSKTKLNWQDWEHNRHKSYLFFEPVFLKDSWKYELGPGLDIERWGKYREEGMTGQIKLWAKGHQKVEISKGNSDRVSHHAAYRKRISEKVNNCRIGFTETVTVE